MSASSIRLIALVILFALLSISGILVG